MAIDFGRKALSKLSGFLSSAKISRCTSPVSPNCNTLAVQSPPVVTTRNITMQAEFDEIEKNEDWPRIYAMLRMKADTSQCTFRVARKAENKKLNRYTDVLPFDHSRVVLSRGSVDYINANTVSYDLARRKYILTQGPLEETCEHFWLMIWENKVPVIIMLNKIIEKNRIKCHKYWPSSDEDLKFESVDLQVELLSEQESDTYICRTIKITDLKSTDSREVVQYQYTEWPDFGIPSCPDEFIKFLDLVRGSGLLSSSDRPPVVHCSAGIGRSGTFIVVDVALKLIEEDIVHHDQIDIQEILLELRGYRLGLIQTPEQLKFAYIVLIEAVKRRKGISESADDKSMEEDYDEVATTPEAEMQADVEDSSVANQNGENADDRSSRHSSREAGVHASGDDENTTNEADQVTTKNLENCRERQSSPRIEMDSDEKIITDEDEDKSEGEVVRRKASSKSTPSPTAKRATTTEESRDQGAVELLEEDSQSVDGEKDKDKDAEEFGDSKLDFLDGEDSSPPQKRTHGLSLNNSDCKEEPNFKRTKSHDD